MGHDTAVGGDDLPRFDQQGGLVRDLPILFYLSNRSIHFHLLRTRRLPAMKAVFRLSSLVLLSLPLLSQAAAPPPLDGARLAALLKQLDDDDYDSRTAADRELRTVHRAALPVLRDTMARSPSLEVRHRLEGIIREITAGEHVPPLVRLLSEQQVDIQEQADYELRHFGKVIVPLLKKELKTASDEKLRQRLRQLITDLDAPR
jgi:hypothetical protein